MNLAAAGVEINQRKYVKVDKHLRTTAPHIFAAGDVTGRLMLVPEAIQDGFIAATNAVQGPTLPLELHVSPVGSFTDPEYAQVGLSEAKARQAHDIVTAIVNFDATTRMIVDGRTLGFLQAGRDIDLVRAKVIERLQHQPKGLGTGARKMRALIENVRFQNVHGAADHLHVRLERSDNLRQELAPPPHFVEHVADDRREQVLAQAREQDGFLHLGHLSS
jgi:hypothetical protein